MQNKTQTRLWPYGPVGMRAIEGVANGLTVPSIRLLLALPAPNAETTLAAHQGLKRLAEVLGPGLSESLGDADASAASAAVQLQHWVALMSAALSQVDPNLGTQVAGAPQEQWRASLFRRQSQPVPGWLVFWPAYWPKVLARVLAWSLDQWRVLCLQSDERQVSLAVEAAQHQWKQLCQWLRQQMPAGLNPARLLAAARALKRPVFWLEQDLLQVGHGRRARWLRSTMTDATPSISVSLARDKVRTNRLLRQAGLPIPQHSEAPDADGAVATAEHLGWPVVVKPADQDRGDGARANLLTPEQVRAAFEHASKFSKRVLVEQHIHGHEYRLTVVHGQLLWAHERVPATVAGDGQHTLKALINAENAQRRQALLTEPNGWVPIKMDADNLAYLQEMGLSPNTVPAAGEVVRLQRVPAATTGGGGRAYFDTIHPDNRLLAEQAARMLRLDVAGVDLIMPDITRSWREVGGAVTEVNAIPQVSIQTDPTLAQRLLQQVMPHSGRIPVLFVLAETTPAWVGDVVQRLNETGLRVGLSTDVGLHIGENWIRGPRDLVWDDIRALQIDPGVGAIVAVSNGDALLQTGLPFDTVDALVVEAHRPQVLSLMLPYARGFKAVSGDGLRQQYGALMHTAGQSWLTWASTPEAVPEQICALSAALLSAEAEHAQGTVSDGAVAEEVVDEVRSTAAFRTQALAWLQTWQDLIAAEDYEEAARGLFDEAVVGFGTVAAQTRGLDELLHTQWLNVWGRTRRFAFVPESLVVWPSADGSTMTVAVQWRSEGVDARSGELFARQGRATIVLQRHDAGWRARHTHFSLNPAPERFLPSTTDGT